MHLCRFQFLAVLILLVVGAFASTPDSTRKRYDPAVDGRPFSLDEITGNIPGMAGEDGQSGVPDWVTTGRISSDTVYYGIGQSNLSQLDADDRARLEFARMVETKVNSMARQAVTENANRLTEEYTFESLVTTDLSLRGIKITERYSPDSLTFFSLLRYGKTEYQQLLTQEISTQLEADIQRQQLRMAATQTLMADSLRHKQIMDSLALAQEQTRVDSLQHILDMERARVEQSREARRILQDRYEDFLEIIPYYRSIDGLSASLPPSYGDLGVRWNPSSGNIREIRLGSAFSIVGFGGKAVFNDFVLSRVEANLKLLVLPPRGEIYRFSFLLGAVTYASTIAESIWLDLQDPTTIGDALSTWTDPAVDGKPTFHSSFLVAATLGLPQVNSHLGLQADQRRIALTNTWYPFVHNLGEALSLVTQLDYILDEAYRNHFGDAVEAQIGIRFIAIENRFATLLAYEDHEWWRLSFDVLF